MAEQQRKAPDRPATERYYTEYVRLSTEGDGAEAILQEAMNEGARQSWQLVSVAKAPAGEGFLLVWDTSGILSG